MDGTSTMMPSGIAGSNSTPPAFSSPCASASHVLTQRTSSTEQTIGDFAEKFTPTDLDEIKNAVSELREVCDHPDREIESLRTALGTLQAIMHKFAELMYSAPDGGDYLS